jgi:SAM-dependent methyltransferase
MTHDPVDMNFESVAERYSGRISYLPGFFAKAVELFGVSKESSVLDLGCGTAALSLGFAPYCQSVLGVDKSASMLAHRRGTPANVRFMHADFNDANISLPIRADLVVIGNAVHFFDKERLIPLLNAATAPTATVLICGTAISPKTPWFAEYLRLRRQHGTVPSRLDVEGKARFAGTEWSRKRVLRVTARRPFSTRDLLDHALTYPCAAESILRNKGDFEHALERLLAPYCKTPNRTVVEIVSWGIEHKRP